MIRLYNIIIVIRAVVSYTVTDLVLHLVCVVFATQVPPIMDLVAPLKKTTKSQVSPSSAVANETSSGYSTATPSALAEVRLARPFY